MHRQACAPFFSSACFRCRCGAQADPRACLVVAVSEGDAFTARCGTAENHEQIKVRIAAIDAPGMGQPFGPRARNALRDLRRGEMAKIDPITMDRHGRTVAYVKGAGKPWFGYPRRDMSRICPAVRVAE